MPAPRYPAAAPFYPAPAPAPVPVPDAGPKVLKVGAQTSRRMVAGAIAHISREGDCPSLLASGSLSVSHATTAIAIARSYLAGNGVELRCYPEFSNLPEQETASAYSFLLRLFKSARIPKAGPAGPSKPSSAPSSSSAQASSSASSSSSSTETAATPAAAPAPTPAPAPAPAPAAPAAEAAAPAAAAADSSESSTAPMPAPVVINATDDSKDAPLKVSAHSNPSSVAGAIANRVRQKQHVSLLAIGAPSITAAVKAITLARKYLIQDSTDISFRPDFASVTFPDGSEAKAALRLNVLSQEL